MRIDFLRCAESLGIITFISKKFKVTLVYVKHTHSTLTQLKCTVVFVYGARVVRMLLHFNIYYNPPHGTCQLDWYIQDYSIQTPALFMTLRGNKLLCRFYLLTLRFACRDNSLG
jgi:hypothetical protein